MTLHSTGHLFFTLKDKKAQIRAIMFRSQAQFLPFKPENGLQVVIRGRINVYEPRGEYQILADVMEPLGKGSLQLAFEQIKNVIKGRETFRRCAALVGQCSRMVVVDSSFLHLSGALGIPTIALFFATSGRVVTRYYRNVRICTPEKSDFPCYPCWRNEHKPCHLTNGRESICARSITVEQVMGALTTDVEHWRVKPNPLARLKTWILYGRE